MTRGVSPSSGPGPVWWWALAWGLQGAGMVWFEPLETVADVGRFGAMSAVAAVPLVALYLTLARRAARGGLGSGAS